MKLEHQSSLLFKGLVMVWGIVSRKWHENAKATTLTDENPDVKVTGCILGRLDGPAAMRLDTPSKDLLEPGSWALALLNLPFARMTTS
ncbi:MAG: hypothetical protein RQ741_04285 [Wenzhouxiangellaceae bacterium]|nr:hypothetical protein [Wenzhouxiangellaceae bacterium]